MVQTRGMIREATMAAGMYFLLTEWLPHDRSQRDWIKWLVRIYFVATLPGAFPPLSYGPGFDVGDYVEPTIRPW